MAHTDEVHDVDEGKQRTLDVWRVLQQSVINDNT